VRCPRVHYSSTPSITCAKRGTTNILQYLVLLYGFDCGHILSHISGRIPRSRFVARFRGVHCSWDGFPVPALLCVLVLGRPPLRYGLLRSARFCVYRRRCRTPHSCRVLHGCWTRLVRKTRSEFNLCFVFCGKTFPKLAQARPRLPSSVEMPARPCFGDSQLRHVRFCVM
jgi:hypothetical protein